MQGDEKPLTEEEKKEIMSHFTIDELIAELIRRETLKGLKQ